MPSRNEPCPCGSATKYKRCCLPALDGVTRELRERDAVLGELLAWVEAEHAGALEDGRGETALMRLLGGPKGRNLSIVWALSDFRPADGGPPLIARFAELPGLDPSVRAIARGLADARVGVYRVGATVPGAWLEIEPLVGGDRQRIPARDGLGVLGVGEILVGRVVSATTIPTLWGVSKRFPGGGERRWRARLADLPDDPGLAALTLLGFHPDDAAEPYPDGLELVRASWAIDDDEEVIDAIEADDIFECLGEEIAGGCAFAWLDETLSGAADLGGWREDDGDIEVARVVVGEDEMTLVSGDQTTLETVAIYLAQILGDVFAGRSDTLDGFGVTASVNLDDLQLAG